MAKNNDQLYGVIGLGRFGFALAESLAKAGKEVLALDNNPETIRQAAAFTDNAFTMETLNRRTLEEVGIKNCDTVIIGVGQKIDTCILTTMTVISMGIPHVIAKANTAEQGMVLEKLGAQVVFPERDMAVRLANRLLQSTVMEYIALNNEVEITEIRLPAKVSGRSILDLDFRKRFGLNIIAIEHGVGVETEITPERLLEADDVIVVIGKSTNVQKLQRWLEA